MSVIGWIANICLVIGYYFTCRHAKAGFVWSTVGNLFWAYEGLAMSRIDLVVVCFIFMLISAYGYLLWSGLGLDLDLRQWWGKMWLRWLYVQDEITWWLLDAITNRNGDDAAEDWLLNRTPFPVAPPNLFQYFDGFWNYVMRKYAWRKIN